MGLHVDGAAGALVLADGPVLLEGAGSINGGLVDAGGLGNLVGGAVGGESALVVGVGGWVVGAEVLDNVVLN